MATTQVIYLGALRVENKHLKSGKIIQTDAPTDNNGKGESFSPTDLVATSLASCMITIMGIRAEKGNFELGKVKADVFKHMASDPRRIEKIEVIFEFENKFDDKTRLLLQRVALSCPVAESLHPKLIQDVKFNFSA